MEERGQAVLFGLISTGFSYGIWWLMSRYLRELDGPMLISPAILLPTFAFVLLLNRTRFPASAQVAFGTMIKYNIASYFIGIAGACLLFTISGYVISTIGATLSLYGFMIWGRALQLAKHQEQR